MRVNARGRKKVGARGELVLAAEQEDTSRAPTWQCIRPFGLTNATRGSA